MRGMHSANGGQMGAEAETGSLGNTVFTSAGFTPASTIAHTQCGACAFLRGVMASGPLINGLP